MRGLAVKNRCKIPDLSSAVEYFKKRDLIINRKFLDLFAYLGLNHFDSIWDYQGGEIIKRIKTRSVIRIEFQNHDEKKCFYLKRHNMEYVGLQRLLSPFFPKWILSQGRKEFENICDFRKCNLPTVVPLAAGEKFVHLFWVQSFVITENFAPFISLEQMFRDHPEFLIGPEGNSKKRTLIKEIALLARRMHQNGFNHRDFNATHILIYYEKGSEIPKLALFDLQRVDRKRFLRFRWIIKSIAELNYTMPDKIFSERDRLYLFLSYRGKTELHAWDHLQWLWIKRKTTRIKRHTEKTIIRKQKQSAI